MVRVWRVIILLMRTKCFGPGWVKAVGRITVLLVEQIVYQYEYGSDGMWVKGGFNKIILFT